MLNLGTRVYVTAAIVGIIAAVAYGVAVGDRAGADLLLVAAGAAAVLAAVTAFGVGADSAPRVPADAPAPERKNAYTEGDVPSASAWPFVAAVALAGIGLATVAGAQWLAFAGVLSLVPAAGWLAHVWREHPSFSPRVRERVVERFLAPVGMPVLGVLAVAVMAISVSRVLLAVPDKASTAAAFGVAVVVLIALAMIASRPALRSSAIIGVGAVAVVGMLAAGAIGAKAGERNFEHEGSGPPTRNVVAHNVQFSTATLSFPADTDVQIRFTNRDPATYHNVAFYTSADADRKPLFNGKPVPGPERILYRTHTPAAGTYTFFCDFHPNMTGKLVITPR